MVRAIGVKVTGASHRVNAKPCQDYYLIDKTVFKGREFLLCAVCDGHGSEKYYLSEHGARFAAECVIAALKALCRKHKTVQALYDALRADFPDLVYKSWTEAAEADYKERFPGDTVNEAALIHKKYGTTAMFGVFFDDVCMFGKLDGNIVISKDGELYEPAEESDELIGSEAYSLCKKHDALSKWGVGIVYGADFVMLSTDGLRNSFGEDDDNALFLECAKDIRRHILENGLPSAEAALPAFLERCTVEGSGDDITVCCAAASKEGERHEEG
jgi:serine/threonine protein phosphatase PrpC